MAAGPTFDPITSVTLSGPQTSIQLDGIPQGYTDLVLVLSVSRNYSNAGDRDIFIRFNGDSGSNYSRTRAYMGGSDRNTNATSLQLGSSGDLAEGRAPTRLFIQNFSNTVAHKPALARYGRGGNNGQVFMGVGTWRSTSAINSITIFETTDGFVAGDTIDVFGIASA